MKQVKEYGWTNLAAGKVAKLFIWLQTKFANVMNKQFSKMPHKKFKVIVIIFCICSGGFSVYLAAHAIFGPVKEQSQINVEQMNVPQHFNKTGSEVNKENYTVSKDLYENIQAYKKSMDSLGLPIRQTLMDSIKVLEDIYQSQNLK